MPKSIEIAGRTLEVLPATLRALRETVLPALERMSKASGSRGDNVVVWQGEMYWDMVLIIHAGLVRATPDLTLEWLEENLDRLSVVEPLQIVLSASGLREAQPGEDLSP